MPQDQCTETRGTHIHIHHGRLLDCEIVALSKCNLPLARFICQRLEPKLPRRYDSSAQNAWASWHDITHAAVGRDDALLISTNLRAYVDVRPKVLECEVRLQFLWHCPRPQNHYSQVVDLTDTALVETGSEARSGTRIISPAAVIPGTWGSAQIPAESLIKPLVVMDLNAPSAQISVDYIANWEVQHGNVPQGAIVAVRRIGSANSSSSDQFPLSSDAAQFLMDARDTRGFLVETPASLGPDRTLSRQIALMETTSSRDRRAWRHCLRPDRSSLLPLKRTGMLPRVRCAFWP